MGFYELEVEGKNISFCTHVWHVGSSMTSWFLTWLMTLNS